MVSFLILCFKAFKVYVLNLPKFFLEVLKGFKFYSKRLTISHGGGLKTVCM